MTVAMTRMLVAGLQDATDPQIQTAIEVALTRLHPQEWGVLYAQAVAYMAGHVLLRAGVAGSVGAGAVTSKGTGGLSESYAPGSDADMGTTSAGVDYLALRKRAIMPARIVH